jgi:hypothetical protein
VHDGGIDCGWSGDTQHGCCCCDMAYQTGVAGLKNKSAAAQLQWKKQKNISFKRDSGSWAATTSIYQRRSFVYGCIPSLPFALFHILSSSSSYQSSCFTSSIPCLKSLYQFFFLPGSLSFVYFIPYPHSCVTVHSRLCPICLPALFRPPPRCRTQSNVTNMQTRIVVHDFGIKY